MCVLECFLIGDSIVGDPPPVIFFGTFSTSWKLESTVRNWLSLRLVFTSDGVGVAVVIRSVELMI